jgi:hypothetical protein
MCAVVQLLGDSMRASCGNTHACVETHRVPHSKAEGWFRGWGCLLSLPFYTYRDSMRAACNLNDPAAAFDSTASLHPLQLPPPPPATQYERQLEVAAVGLGPDAEALGGVAPNASFSYTSSTEHCGKLEALRVMLAEWAAVYDKRGNRNKACAALRVGLGWMGSDHKAPCAGGRLWDSSALGAVRTVWRLCHAGHTPSSRTPVRAQRFTLP